MSQSTSDDELAEEVRRAGFASLKDPREGLHLQELLLDVRLRLDDGDVPEDALLVAAATWVARVPYVVRDPAALELDPERSMDLAEQAAESVRDPRVRSELRAQSAIDRFLVLRQPRAPDEAEAKFRGLVEAQPRPSPIVRAWLQLEVADLVRLRADFEAARELIEEAQSWVEEGASGEEYFYDGAFDSGPQAKAVQAGVCARLRARVELGLGQLELDLGRPDLAARHYLASRPYVAQADPRSQVEQSLNEVRFWISVQDYGRVIEVASGLPDRPELSAAERSQALLALGVARFQRARETSADLGPARADLERALELATGPAFAAACRLRLAEVALESGDHDGTRGHLDEARALLGEDLAVSPAVPAQLAYLEARLTRLDGQASDEDLRSRRDRLREVVEDSLGEFAGMEPALGGVGYLHHPHRVEPLIESVLVERALAGEVVDDFESQRMLEPWVRAQMLGFLARGFQAERPGLADVRRVLPPDGILLGFLPGQGTSLLFVLEDGPLEVHEVPGTWRLRARVESQVERLVRAASGARVKGLEEAAAELGQDLLPESVRERLTPGRRVVVVGAELLGRMPLESLRLHDDAWLGDTVSIEHWPSIPVAVELAHRTGARERRNAGPPRALAYLAPTSKVPGLAALHVSADEREALEDAWPELEVVIGADATESSLTRLQEAPYDAAIFVMHGLDDPRLPIPTGMAFAPERPSEEGGERKAPIEDGALWAEELRELEGVPPLVVLGVCGASFGAQRLGEDGATHLGGLWLERGAERVVISSFRLERGETLQLVARFGVELGNGASVPEALRAARSALAEGRPDSIRRLLVQVVGWCP
ncbi:MAG TPA: CHAT domain-containing protein [Planctomycetota bacterium]|nr:CHAT domain-containing protein [Planctomycetota bacterium]